MKKMPNMVRRVGMACLLGSVCLWAGGPAHQAHADAFTVSTFYTTTSGTTPYDTIDQWCQSDATCGPPPKVGVYPTGQAVIDFYYGTNFQTQSVLDMQNVENHFTILISTSGGATFLRCTLSGVSFPSCDNPQAHGSDRVYEGNGMVQLWAPQQPQDTQPSAYPNDTYTAAFLVDGQVYATTAFRVGPPNSHPGPTTATRVLAFYPISYAGGMAWMHHKVAAPPKVSTFGAASTYVTFYLRYSGFTAAIPLTVRIDAPGQRLPIVVDGPHIMPRASGALVFSEAAPASEGWFPGGAYTASILAGPTGRVVARITFKVSS